MSIGQGLELNIAQKQTLALTPQLLQAITVLGMTRTELDEYIAAELEGNPALDAVWDDDPAQENWQNTSESEDHEDERAPADRRAEDFDWVEYLNEKEYDDVSYGYGSSSDLVPDRFDTGVTLREYLLEQLESDVLKKISPDENRAYELIDLLIETLDENGFLTQTISEFAKAAGATEEEAHAAVLAVQGLEPAGVGAADVRESLVLQYRHAGGEDPLVTRIIEDHLSNVASRRASSIAKTYGRKRADVERAFEIIAALNPKPGVGFANGTETPYVIPDIMIEKTDGGYEVRMNSTGIPRLSVSPYYRKVLTETKKGSDEYVFLLDRLNSAAALIKSLEQRGRTIYNIMTAILSRQHSFLDEGKASLKPMTLRQIADEIGVHESTVSRAVRGKYVQLPGGAIEIRQFFGSGVRTADGAGAHAESVKAKIVSIIEGEDKKVPFSDRALAEMLGDGGIYISRRTVAKYRNEAGIPSASKRMKK